MKRKRIRQKKAPTNKPLINPTVMTSVGSLVDIVIPVRGRFDLLEKCLASINGAFSTVKYNIIIFDNASDEIIPPSQVREFYYRMETDYPDLTVIRNEGNAGFPQSCNRASRRKASPLIFFLNSDVILDPGSGLLLVAAMDTPEVGIAGMKLRFASEHDYVDANMDFNIRPPGRLQHICLSVNYAGRIYHPFLGWSLDHPRINGLQTVFAVTGAAMMVRRSLFVQAGGFLEDYGMGTFEDVDLCMMSRELGLNVVTVPAAEAVHYTNATAEQLKLGFPMHINDSLFKARWGSKLIWWDFFTL